MPQWDRLLQRVGDWLFNLRATLDRLRHRRAEGPGLSGTAAQAASSVRSFDWSTFKSPRKLRKFLDENQFVFAGLAGVVMLASFYIIFRRIQPPPISRFSTDTEYFYDLSTGLVFVKLINGQTVADSPSGGHLADGTPAGVKAQVYSCGDCESESSLFVGYLMVSTEEQAIPTSQPAEGDEADPAPRRVAGGMLIARPPSSTVRLQAEGVTASQPAKIQWVPIDSAEATAILNAPQQRCGSQLVLCAPLE